MKRIIIWLLVLLLPVMPTVYSADVVRDGIYNNMTILLSGEKTVTNDSSKYFASNITSQGDITIGNQTLIFSGVQSSINSTTTINSNNEQLSAMQNFSVVGWLNLSVADITDLAAIASMGAANFGSEGWWWCYFRTVPNRMKFTYQLNTPGETVVDVAYSTEADIVVSGGNTEPILLGCHANRTGTTVTVYISINGTYVAEASGTTTTIDHKAGAGRQTLFGKYDPTNTGIRSGIKNLFITNKTMTTTELNWTYNKTKYYNWSASVAPPDTTPPEITYFNLTNGNGCEVWNTSKNIACNTTSGTPTVQFNTDENAWCAISGNGSATLGKNYTDMGSSKNCTGAAAGEGTTSHLCTLISQDELIFETSYIYISCKDSSNNQNRTSTSGPLNVSVTAEANARDAIEQGIRNALGSIGYTTYTDQRIYARNSANTQSTGRFDKVVKKLTKIWVFNRIGPTESHVNMFNITPVLYTLEFANKTSVQIINQTEILINTTR